MYIHTGITGMNMVTTIMGFVSPGLALGTKEA